MNSKKVIATIAIVGLVGGMAAGCTKIKEGEAYVEKETGLGQKAQMGAVGGAAGFGLLAAAVGASPVGIAAGVILGGLAGGAIGNLLDDKDKQLALQAQQRAFDNKNPMTTHWTNPDSGVSGTYTTQTEYVTVEKLTCKDFVQTITHDGKTETETGTACLLQDGTWQVHKAK